MVPALTIEPPLENSTLFRLTLSNVLLPKLRVPPEIINFCSLPLVLLPIVIVVVSTLMFKVSLLSVKVLPPLTLNKFNSFKFPPPAPVINDTPLPLIVATLAPLKPKTLSLPVTVISPVTVVAVIL